jgi:uncharacterized membrane protein
VAHPEQQSGPAPDSNPEPDPAEQTGMRQAKRPLTLLAGTYGHPIHPALVALPIGAWVASFVFDLASRVVAQPAFLSEGSRWLIVIGILGAVVAATAGALDLFAIPTGTPAFRTGLVHMTLNLAATVAYAVNVLVLREETAGPVGWGAIVLSAVSLALVGAAGFLGGKLAYRYGVRVADERTQAEGYRTPHQRRS